MSTPVDRLLYAVWWTPVSHCLPLWLSPNSLTLLGCWASIFSTIVVVSLSPSMAEAVPWWAELFVAFLLFVYQTCDAVDGMQARRTGASSPLGSLLDHGCDCLCTSAITVGLCVSVGEFGLSPPLFASLCLTWLPWWTAQWESLHTGILQTSNALIGVTEGELAVIFGHLVTAIMGPAFWRETLPLPGFGARMEFRFGMLAAQFAICVTLFASAVHRLLHKLGSLSAVIEALQQVFPMLLLFSVALLWPTTLPELHTGFLCLSLMAIFSHLGIELSLCSMTHQKYPSPQLGLLLLPIMYVAGLLGLLLGWVGSALMLAFAAITILETSWFVKDVLEEVTTHFGVHLIRLGRLDD